MKLRCCICEQENTEKIYKKIGDFTLLRCPQCNLVYLKEVSQSQDSFIISAREDLNKKQREKVEYWSFPHLYEKYRDIFHYYFKERLSHIRQFKSDIKSVFDIGCGYGFWLKFCKDRGIEVKGIDLSEEAINYAKTKLNLDVEKYTLEDYKFDRQYDAIVICDLLEHLYEPNSQLKKINRVLSETGILFIQIPNLLGFKLPPFHGFGLPYHIWHFDTSSLKLLLKKNGFKILKWWTGVMGVIGVYESGGPNFYHKITWQLAKQLKIGNRLMAVANKA